jgi:hypothetical protein
MLDPNERHLYVDALRPPHGYQLREAIATTYSLDMTTLLGIPIALALPHLDARKLGQESAVMLLEALRRSSRKISVFCDRGGIAAPSTQHVLYPLLERVIVEVQAPNGGCLHSKLWLLCYEREEAEQGDELVMRLVILSRNLTADRCWDVTLSVDGALSGRNRAANRPLCELIERLPQLAAHEPSSVVTERVKRMSEQARRTEWELPAGFDELRFHCLGLSTKAKSWLPESSDRLLVVSPFVRDRALQELAASTRERVALIARGEELDALSPETRRLFGKVLVLHDRAETEEGEDIDATDGQTPLALFGLHAKVYVAKRGWDTHLYLGSGNATNAALINGNNIEILAELIGKASKVKGIDQMLDQDGMGALLVEYTPSEANPDPAVEAAEQALDAVRIALATANLHVRFERNADGADDLTPWLGAPQPLPLEGVTGVRAWLVTLDSSSSRDVAGLGSGERVSLAPCTSASSTGLIAFQLTNERAQATFVLNLPLLDPPSDRDAQVVRLVINNRERFFALLLALLEDFDADVVNSLERNPMGGSGAWRDGAGGSGMLEQLVRARARDPRRLDELRAVVDDLQSTPEGRAVIPPEFSAVWEAIVAEDVS